MVASTEDETIAWRYGVFRALGFDTTQSMQLSASRADTHDVAAALARGCTHELATRIFS